MATLDRLSSRARGFVLLSHLRARGVRFIALDGPLDTGTEAGRRAATIVGRIAARELWQHTAEAEPAWDGRNEIIGGLISPGTAVLELGAGARTLERYLPVSCEYQPCDCVDGPVLYCDLDAGVWPAVNKRYVELAKRWHAHRIYRLEAPAKIP